MLRFNKILLFLISFWILIAAFRTFYNFSKLYTEEKNWLGLTSEEKRGKYFGDTHYFLRFLDSKTTENSTIFFATYDLKSYYLGRYYIYPGKKIYGIHGLLEKRGKLKDYDYVAIYSSDPKLFDQTRGLINMNDYETIATYSGKNNDSGIIYKK